MDEEVRLALRAIGDGKRPVDEVRGDSVAARVRQSTQIAMEWYSRAKAEEWAEEADRLGCAPFSKTAWQVMRDAFVESARQVGDFPQDEGRWLDGDLRRFCAWLATGEGSPDEDFQVAYELLDTKEFQDRLLDRLWNECSPECGDMEELPRPKNLAEPLLLSDVVAMLNDTNPREPYTLDTARTWLNKHDFAIYTREEWRSKFGIVPSARGNPRFVQARLVRPALDIERQIREQAETLAEEYSP